MSKGTTPCVREQCTVEQEWDKLVSAHRLPYRPLILDYRPQGAGAGKWQKKFQIQYQYHREILILKYTILA